MSNSQSELLSLKAALRSENAPIFFPVGTTIPDTWTDVYTNHTHQAPFVIVSYQKLDLPSGKTCFGAILLRKYTSPFRVKYGDSRLRHSALLEWANSDNCINQIGRHGYLTGCSTELLQITTPVILKPDTQKDVNDAFRFFPPSLGELDLAEPGIRSREKPWNYFKNPQHRPIFKDLTGQAQDCWLRSTKRGGATHVWTVSPHGSAILHNTTTENFCVFACAVKP